jgi:hypothetical protein
VWLPNVIKPLPNASPAPHRPGSAASVDRVGNVGPLTGDPRMTGFVYSDCLGALTPWRTAIDAPPLSAAGSAG